MKIIRSWILQKKLSLAQKWLAQVGLIAVEIRNVGGADYLVCNDGQMLRIGVKGKK